MAGSMLEKANGGLRTFSEAEAALTQALLIRKKRKKIPHKLHRPGQALMLL